MSSGHSKRPTLPINSLEYVGTGRFRYKKGHNSKAISGSKEGNNAFTEDNDMTDYNSYFDIKKLLMADPS
jgi:hypothetical protein